MNQIHTIAKSWPQLPLFTEFAAAGKDLNSVSKLLKKLQATEADIVSRKETLKNLEDQYAKFEAANHFMLLELEQKFSNITQRYDALNEPVQIRRENLEDSLLLHQFNREVADETIDLIADHEIEKGLQKGDLVFLY